MSNQSKADREKEEAEFLSKCQKMQQIDSLLVKIQQNYDNGHMSMANSRYQNQSIDFFLQPIYYRVAPAQLKVRVTQDQQLALQQTQSVKQLDFNMSFTKKYWNEKENQIKFPEKRQQKEKGKIELKTLNKQSTESKIEEDSQEEVEELQEYEVEELVEKEAEELKYLRSQSSIPETWENFGIGTYNNALDKSVNCFKSIAQSAIELANLLQNLKKPGK